MEGVKGEVGTCPLAVVAIPANVWSMLRKLPKPADFGSDDASVDYVTDDGSESILQVETDLVSMHKIYSNRLIDSK